MHFSGSRWCIGSLGRVTKRLFSAGKVLFRPPGTKVIVSKLAIVSSRKAPVWSRQELHHRRLPYSGSQHFGDLHTVFKAEHQIPILVNRHPVDQIQPKPVAIVHRQRGVNGHQLGHEALHDVSLKALRDLLPLKLLGLFLCCVIPLSQRVV